MSDESWRSLVNLEKLTNWMDDEQLESGPIRNAQALQGGTQNVLLRFERGRREFVLRRPPLHPYMDGSETMLREARTLAALSGSSVPHPALIAVCPDADVLGAAFYLMAPVNGFNVTVGMPALHAGDPSIRRRMGFALVDAAVALGNVDHAAAGLSLRGDPQSYLARQVDRWRSQFERYCEYPGWPGPQTLAGVESVGQWLDTNRPASFRPGIIHGDYHLANVLYEFEGPRIAAVVDWELSTVGDPLLDLGWLIATWPDEGGDGGTSRVQPWDGFPTIGELIERYRQSSPRDLSRVAWYGVLACYKLGIILEGTHARACAGKAPQHTGAELHASAVRLFERAARLIGARNELMQGVNVSSHVGVSGEKH